MTLTMETLFNETTNNSNTQQYHENKPVINDDIKVAVDETLKALNMVKEDTDKLSDIISITLRDNKETVWLFDGIVKMCEKQYQRLTNAYQAYKIIGNERVIIEIIKTAIDELEDAYRKRNACLNEIMSRGNANVSQYIISNFTNKKGEN